MWMYLKNLPLQNSDVIFNQKFCLCAFIMAFKVGHQVAYCVAWRMWPYWLDFHILCGELSGASPNTQGHYGPLYTCHNGPDLGQHWINAGPDLAHYGMYTRGISWRELAHKWFTPYVQKHVQNMVTESWYCPWFVLKLYKWHTRYSICKIALLRIIYI